MHHARAFAHRFGWRPVALISCTAVLVSAPVLPVSGAASTGGFRNGGQQLAGGYGFNGAESCLIRKINRARRSRGMSSLNWDKQIGYVARRHASTMAQNRTAFHDYSLGQKVTRWRRLGQNTARGGRCRRIFPSFMHSTRHRANILGRWRHVGVGAVWAGGRLYVQQVFESRLNPGNIYSYP